jgi:[ribosomal protein S5]-alanine N-acetyltransferase
LGFMVTLRPLTLEDAPRMAELGNNEKISRNLRDGFPHPFTVQHAEEKLRVWTEKVPCTFFAIEWNGEYVGNISLSPGTDVYRKTAEIGYFIGEPYWNKGIATKAVKLIVEYGFKELGLARIHTGVFDYNEASMRVLEKCGFERDGVFKKAVIKNGQFRDEVRYSIVNLLDNPTIS